MYCAGCGRPLSVNLNYCNSCGARNEKNALVVSNSSNRMMGFAGPAVAIVGLIGFIEVLKMLLNSRLDSPAVILILLAYLLTVFLMFAVLIGHVWKRSGDIRIKSKDRDDDYNAPSSFRGVNTAQLGEPRQPAMSVTENTTRTLENVPFSHK